MKDDPILISAQRLDVRKGDVLYIRLPKGMTDKKVQLYAENIHEFFQHLKCKILIGDEEIEFVIVNEEDEKGSLN